MIVAGSSGEAAAAAASSGAGAAAAMAPGLAPRPVGEDPFGFPETQGVFDVVSSRNSMISSQGADLRGNCKKIMVDITKTATAIDSTVPADQRSPECLEAKARLRAALLWYGRKAASNSDGTGGTVLSHSALEEMVRSDYEEVARELNVDLPEAIEWKQQRKVFLLTLEDDRRPKPDYFGRAANSRKNRSAEMDCPGGMC